MSTTAIPDKFIDLFAKKAFAHLATLMPGGEPQVTPVWIDYDGERVVFNTAAGRQKDKNLQRDGRCVHVHRRSRQSLSLPRNPWSRERTYDERRGRAH
jgi:hypothetical protein